MTLFPHDWQDVGLHVLVAFVAVLMLTVLGLARHSEGLMWGAVVANTLGWPLREAVQRRKKDRHDWNRPWLWSAQKHWEAWTPVAVGWLVALALTSVGG